MSEERTVEKQELKDLEAALKKVYEEAPSGHGSLSGVITKEKQAELYAMGDPDALESLVISFITYLADMDAVNPFDKVLSMQTKLMYANPDMYKAYLEGIHERYGSHEEA